MSSSLALLRFVAKAALSSIGAGIISDFAVDVLPEIARDVWQWWAKDRNPADLRAELEGVASLPSTQVKQLAAEVVSQEGVGRPETVRQLVTAYLVQMPDAIRQSQRRPQDPSGRSISGRLPLRTAEDLLPLLPPRPPRFKPGARPLPGVDLELVELLGMGGFGEVWKAKNPYMPPVALKFCLDPQAAKVLRNEAALLGRVASQGQLPRIVQLRNTYLSADPPCLEYEYVAGGDLAGFVYQQMQRNQGGLPPDLVVKIVRNLARAIGHAHLLKPPIVHRDLKPANILVERATDGTVNFRITDFGIGGVAAGQAVERAKGVSTSHFQTTALRGAHTPLYASPQQIAGDPPDPRDDVHALGVIWYQMLVGDFSVGAPIGSAWKDALIQRGLSEQVLKLLESCFETQAKHRPDNAAVLAERIEKLGPSKFAKDMKDALEEIRSAEWFHANSLPEWGDIQDYFKRQGPSRIDVWQAAAEQGDAVAQWLLARCLQEGTGVKKDPQTAVSWLRRAADSGLTVAQNDLGYCYHNGLGTDVDLREAFRLYTKAADQRLANAQFNVGWCYEYGEGTQHNPSEAVKWYQRAAEQGIDLAQFNLGYCYQHGYGVGADLAQAEKWYRMAASQGHKGAKNALAQLGLPFDSDEGNKPKDKSEIPEQFRVTRNRLMALRAIETLGGKRVERSQVHKYTADKYGWNSNTTGNATYNCCVSDCTLEWGKTVDDEGGFFTITPKGWRVLAANVGINEIQQEDGPSPISEPVDTTSYWVIAPYSADSPEEWRRVWEFDLANNIISIGWEELGDISSLDEQSLRAAIDRAYPDPGTSAQARGHFFGMLWNFFHKIKLGDVIVARQGLKKLAAVGTVTRTAYYDPNKNFSSVGGWFTFAYHLDVQWDDYPRDKAFDKQVFGMLTVYQIQEEKFCTLIGKDKPIRERWLKSMRLLLEKGATSPDSAVKFSTFRVEAKAAGGIMYGYDGLSGAGLIEWLKREGESGWFLYLTAAGRAALDAERT